MNVKSILAFRLKELRDSLGLNQSEFSESIQLKQPTYNAYEKRANKPQVDTLIKIATKYNVSIDWLCGLSDDEDRPKVTFDTYADVLNVLFEIGVLDMTKTSEYSCDSDCNHFNIYFDDEKMNEALKDWKKMHDFLRDGFVDEEVYLLWVEKTLKKYNIKIADKYETHKGEFNQMDISKN